MAEVTGMKDVNGHIVNISVAVQANEVLQFFSTQALIDNIIKEKKDLKEAFAHILRIVEAKEFYEVLADEVVPEMLLGTIAMRQLQPIVDQKKQELKADTLLQEGDQETK